MAAVPIFISIRMLIKDALKLTLNWKGVLGGICCIFCLVSLPSSAQSKEIRIVFTGQSCASLYPCDCPKKPVGGLARRASVVKELRSMSEDLILVEAGMSFASGTEDLSSQDDALDRLRTEFYLKGLRAIGYDALLAGSQEQVFGWEFLKGHQDLPFVAANVEGFPRGFLIKDLGWIRVGIVGLSDAVPISDKELKWQEPFKVLRKTITRLKKKEGVDFIILLSDLNPKEDQRLLEKIKGVDVVINGSPSLGSVKLKEVGGVLYLTTWWQTRRVGILTLDVSEGKILPSSLEDRELDEIRQEDEAVLSLLPVCFQGADCPSAIGSSVHCENPGTQEARCSYVERPKINLTVLKPRVCLNCQTDEVIKRLNGFFQRLEIQYLFEDEEAAGELFKSFGITMLPAYVFDKSIEKADDFASFKSYFKQDGDFYLLKPSEAGVSYLLGRERVPEKLDVFFDFSYPQSPEFFKLLGVFAQKHENYDVRVNFLAIRNESDELVAKGGQTEVEEFRRVASMDALYPHQVFNYLACRASQMQRGLDWWGDCAVKSEIDTFKVKEHLSSESGQAAMDERVRLTNELEILTGPTFVVNNTEIFGIVNVPALEEFEEAVLGKDNSMQENASQKNKKSMVNTGSVKS